MASESPSELCVVSPGLLAVATPTSEPTQMLQGGFLPRGVLMSASDESRSLPRPCVSGLHTVQLFQAKPRGLEVWAAGLMEVKLWGVWMLTPLLLLGRPCS